MHRYFRRLFGATIWSVSGLVVPTVASWSPGIALADYIEPGQVQIKTEQYTPAISAFTAGTYKYSVNWQGIPVASAEITVSSAQPSDASYLKVAATLRTARGIDLFYALRHRSESVFEARTLRPVSFSSSQTENSKTKFREITFADDGTISAKMWKLDKKGNEVPEDAVSFHSDNATFDPISAAFLARSLPITEGETAAFDVFNGKHRFLITFHVGKKETIDVAGEKREAFKVQPSVKKLTDTEGEKRLQSAALWISADDRRDVLKLESSVVVGKVNAVLEQFIPEAAGGSLRASLSLPIGQKADMDKTSPIGKESPAVNESAGIPSTPKQP